MTKAELIELMKDFPDDMDVRMGIRKDTGTVDIEVLCKFCNEIGKCDNYITLVPGGDYREE